MNTQYISERIVPILIKRRPEVMKGLAEFLLIGVKRSSITVDTINTLVESYIEMSIMCDNAVDRMFHIDNDFEQFDLLL